MYTAGLITRQEGDIQGSLELFQKAVRLNPNNATSVKQVARSLYAGGRSGGRGGGKREGRGEGGSRAGRKGCIMEPDLKVIDTRSGLGKGVFI